MATSMSSSNGTNPFRKKKALIAVMGATGSGKSSLIGAITGREDIVGHALESGQSYVVCSQHIISSTDGDRNLQSGALRD